MTYLATTAQTDFAELIYLSRPKGKQLPLLPDEHETVFPLPACVHTAVRDEESYLGSAVETATDPTAWYAALWNVSLEQAATRIVANSPGLLQSLREGEADARAGYFVSWEEVFGED